VRTFTAAASVALFVLFSVVVAEACLLVLLLVFSTTLNAYLSIEFGERFLQNYVLWRGIGSDLRISIPTAGTAASFLITAGGGLVAATWQLKRWGPPS